MAAKSDATLRRVSHALVDQLQTLIPGEVTSRGSAQFPASTARDLIGQVLFLLTDALYTLERPTNTRANELEQHLLARQQAEPTIREVIRQVVGGDTADALSPQASRLLFDLRAVLASTSLPAAVDSRFGTARLIDYLRGALIEAVALALRFRSELVDGAVTEATRALASALGQRHPGAVIEVRVPPAVAVQIGALGQGPSHTRGTPPNVVETDPVTFCALAVGLRTWDTVVASGRVSASGAQVGVLPQMLPVLALSDR